MDTNTNMSSLDKTVIVTEVSNNPSVPPRNHSQFDFSTCTSHHDFLRRLEQELNRRRCPVRIVQTGRLTPSTCEDPEDSRRNLIYRFDGTGTRAPEEVWDNEIHILMCASNNEREIGIFKGEDSKLHPDVDYNAVGAAILLSTDWLRSLFLECEEMSGESPELLSLIPSYYDDEYHSKATVPGKAEVTVFYNCSQYTFSNWGLNDRSLNSHAYVDIRTTSMLKDATGSGIADRNWNDSSSTLVEQGSALIEQSSQRILVSQNPKVLERWAEELRQGKSP